MYPRTYIKNSYMNTKISSTQHHKIHTVWHPTKNYQAFQYMTYDEEKKMQLKTTKTDVKTGRKGHYNNNYNYCIEGHVAYIALT